MDAEKFLESTYDASEKDYGIFLPPTEAQEGLTLLIHHFLGDNWYTANPVSHEQVNTEAIYLILKKYPIKRKHPKKKFLKNLLKLSTK
jgi:hypothetical protein